MRGRKETGPAPPIYGVQGLDASDQEAVEGHMEGPRLEAPQGPSGKWLWKERSTEAVLAFLGSTGVGCISARRTPPEVDGADWGDEGEEGGPGPPVL